MQNALCLHSEKIFGFVSGGENGLFGKMGNGDADALISKNFGEYGRAILTLKKLAKAESIQARMPMDIIIH